MLRLTRAFYACSGNLKTFLALSDHALSSISYKLDKLEDYGLNLDHSIKDGVLKVRIGTNHIVINRQIPNQQIWYSSLLGVPQRFNLYGNKWINSKGVTLDEVFEADVQKSRS